MRIIVHAGPPKTGSSAIQVFLKKNRQTLALEGVYYPETPLGIHHGAYMANLYPDERVERCGFSNPPGAAQPISASEIREKVKSAIRRDITAIKSIQPAAVIFSAEQFSSLGAEADVGGFLQILKKFGPATPEFFLYAREPVGWMASRHLQRLKRGHINSGEGWLRPLKHMRYWTRVETITGQQTLVRAFRRDLFPHGDVVRDFMKAVLPEISLEGMMFSQNINESISAELGLLLAETREQNFSGARSSDRPLDLFLLQRHLREWEKKNGAPRGSYRPLVAEQIIRASRQDMIWLRQKYGVDLGEPESYRTNVVDSEPLEMPKNLSRPDIVRALFQINPQHLTALREEAKDFRKRRLIRSLNPRSWPLSRSLVRKWIYR